LIPMESDLLTRLSLLARLADPRDRAAWREFVELYGTLVYRFARRRGLQDADASDLTQDVFLAIARTAGHWRYDSQKGSFRGWLYGVTRHRLAKFARKRHPRAVGGDAGPATAELVDSNPEWEAAWEREFQQQLFSRAAARVCGRFAPGTWQAFWQTAVEGREPPVVAAELGLSVGAVYVAKSRVLARVAEEVRAIQSE
jgi:RNA polymerase sigma factor (sigma-70 family)